MVENDFVVVDVLGTRFRIQKLLIKKYPSSLFSNFIIDENDDEHDSYHKSLPKGILRTNVNEFFVERSPDLVKIVIQYLVSGTLHVSHWICHEELSEEFAFWRVQPENLCLNCAGDYKDLLISYHNSNNVHTNIFVETRSKWTNFRRNLWTFLENPTSSLSAMVKFTHSFFCSYSKLVINFRCSMFCRCLLLCYLL